MRWPPWPRCAMELKHLASFSAVVRCGSFTKAAEKLYLSQPTVTLHVRALEEELGQQLIIRTTKNLEVTPKGREVYRLTVNILGLQRQIVELCTQGSQRIIHLGASTIPANYILPQLLPAFGKSYPETYFTVQQSNNEGVADGLVNGLFDIGIMSTKEDERLTCIPFCNDRIVLITPVEEPYLSLHNRQELPLLELLKNPIIMREGSTRKAANSFLDDLGICEEQLNITARVNDQEAVKNFVANGLGISLISEWAARNFVDEKRVLRFDLPVHSTRSFYLAYQREYILPPYIKKFLAFARKAADSALSAHSRGTHSDFN